MSKKLIVLICQNYPSPENPFSQTFIHSRVLEYVKEFDMTVVSFAAENSYKFEGVSVFSERDFFIQNGSVDFDLLISHAPNLRNHFRFIFKNLFNFKKLMFVFHGYEVIDIYERVYKQTTHYPFPETLPTVKRLYHKWKLPTVRVLLRILQIIKSCHYIFVSKTLYLEVKQDLKADFFQLGRNCSIIHNPINPTFIDSPYSPKPRFDYICIRPFGDPKYGVDIFIKLAENNPTKSFHLFGKGTLPPIKDLPPNLSVFRKFLTVKELITTLEDYRAAILPTRWDSQGILACEVSALGMPLITSKLKVCEEILGQSDAILMLKNDQFHTFDLTDYNPSPERAASKYTHAQTTKLEIETVAWFIKSA